MKWPFRRNWAHQILSWRIQRKIIPLLVLFMVTCCLVVTTYHNFCRPCSKLFLWEAGEQDILEKLSDQFQIELAAIQNPQSSLSPCSNLSKALLCGHSASETGIAAQLQHRMGCLMMSFALKIPLIHDERSYWTFHEPWRKYFEPFGSKCPTHSFSTLLYWDWVGRKLYKLHPADFNSKGGRVPQNIVESFKFPLTDGILVPQSIALAVEHHHRNPFLWFIGQFHKAVFKLRKEMTDAIQKSKIGLGLSKQQLEAEKGILIGIHVRRTDKVAEVGSCVSTESFMSSVTKYLDHVHWNRTLTPLTIYVATEDCDVITEFRSKFPAFAPNFVSFCNKTMPTFDSRRGDIFGILRDISILADANYVICTFSSNVGRVVLELRSWQSTSSHLTSIDPDPEQKVESLHLNYSFDLYWYPVRQQRLVLVPPRT